MAIKGGMPMTRNPEKHYRRSIRLQGYDYSHAGLYFVTICAKQREWLFGEIVNDNMMLNDAGMMVQQVWNEMPTRFDGIETDEFIVIPNHIHGIIVLPPRRGVLFRYSNQSPRTNISMASKNWVGRHSPALYGNEHWEDIVRDEPDLNRLREYIRHNPAKWMRDGLMAVH